MNQIINELAALPLPIYWAIGECIAYDMITGQECIGLDEYRLCIFCANRRIILPIIYRMSYTKDLIAVSNTAQDVLAGTGRADNFVIRFEEPFVLAGKAADNKGDENSQQMWEMALTEWRGFNSIANISAALYGNNIIEFSTGGPMNQIIIPDGIYSVAQINSYVNSILTAAPYLLPANSVRIVAVTSQDKIQITVAAGISVNLNASNIYRTFGYSLAQSPIVGLTTVIGASAAQMTNGITAYLIRCDAVTGSTLNANASDVIYLYTPDVAPGRSIRVTPPAPMYLPVKNPKEIRQIRLYITDDLGRPVDYRGNGTTWQLHFRRVQKKMY
jgi:hypothetical protein